MIKFSTLLVLTASTLFSQNIIDLSLDHKKQTHTDYLFNELMNERGSSKDNYSKLNKTIDTGYITLKTNFNDMIGFKLSNSLKSLAYSKQLDISIPAKGTDYSSQELYLGTSSIKYISINNINSTIDYGSNKLKKHIKDLTFFGVISYRNETSTSSKVETLSALKVASLDASAAFIPADNTLTIHRDFELEKFTISTENLYDIAKEDAMNNEHYFLPAIFSKKIYDFSVYGVLIVGYTQENYTSIGNYFIDNAGKKHNITYSTRVTENVIDLNQDPKSTKDRQNFVARYDGYEYGYKLTVQYQIKNISLFATGFQKITKLKNKYKRATDQVNIVSASDNVVIYDTLTYKQRSLNFGIKYRF